MSEYEGKYTNVRKVFTTDKNDKDFPNNLEVFDPAVQQEANEDFKQTIGSHIKNIGRYRAMSAQELTKGIRENQKKQKAAEFERIIRYIWEHRVSCLTTDILNHIFGANATEEQRKLIDNRMQDVKFSSHYGKDFSQNELKFFIRPKPGKGEGWEISDDFKGSFRELLSHCLCGMSKRMQYSLYNKRLKTSGKVVGRRIVKKDTPQQLPESKVIPVQFSVATDSGSQEPVIIPLNVHLQLKITVEVITS